MKKIITSLMLVMLFSAYSFAEEINVGLIAALSGPITFYGETTMKGMVLAIDEINAEGGIDGKKINLIIEDNKGDSAETVTIAQKLINVDKVSAVLGPIISTNCLAAAPIFQENKVPMLTATGTNKSITEVGDYISRACFIDPFQGSVMANFSLDNLDAKTAVIMEDSGSDYAKGLADSFKATFEKRGGKVTDKFNYMASDTDYSSILTNVRANQPDVIFVPGYSEVSLIVKQARELGIKSTFLGGDGWDSGEILEAAGDAIDGSYCSTHFSPMDDREIVQEFLKNYNAKYGEDPSVLSALGYDAGLMLAFAIRRAGSTDREAIKEAINSTAGLKGVTGTISLDENRNPIKSATILKAENGKYVFETVVEPTIDDEVEATKEEDGMFKSFLKKFLK